MSPPSPFDNTDEGAEKPINVAILGGGCGALSTAFWLTSTAALRRRYKLTVYTQSWRLGGKCASGRNARNRIEEHGLHVMLGFYKTVFRTMRQCYAELEGCKEFADLGNPAFRSWDEALVPQNDILLWLSWPPDKPDTLAPWSFTFPAPSAVCQELSELEKQVHQAIVWLTRFSVDLREALRPALTKAGWSENRIDSLASPVLALETRLVQLGSDLYSEMVECIRALHGEVNRDLANPGSQTAALTEDLKDLDAGVQQDLYQLRTIQSCAFAAIKGLLTDVIMGSGLDIHAGFDALDAFDFKDWLQSHGATAEAVTCPLVMAFYDLGFAYPGGDSSNPKNGRAAAGMGIKIILRILFDSGEALAYKMRAGMGEAVFTPLYLVLKNRGVDFRLLSEVEELSLSPDHTRIQGIQFRRPPAINANYDPLVKVDFDDGRSWWCWPSQVKSAEQAAAAAAGYPIGDAEDPWAALPGPSGPAFHLEIRPDDKVVLAIPPAASCFLTRALQQWTPGWSEMLAGSNSVATISRQLWYTQTSTQLGRSPPMIGVSFANPLRSWGDMTQVLGAEPRPPGSPAVGSCHYLCGTYSPPKDHPIPVSVAAGGDYLSQQQPLAAAQADQWMSNWAAKLWPGVPAAHLLDPLDRFDKLNVAYTEQYVLSLPGTIQSRLTPGNSGCDNLYLAGDWTRTSINGGCAEAAFESGLAAAAAIAGTSVAALLEAARPAHP